jgi:hypothetical protein
MVKLMRFGGCSPLARCIQSESIQELFLGRGLNVNAWLMTPTHLPHLGVRLRLKDVRTCFAP